MFICGSSPRDVLWTWVLHCLAREKCFSRSAAPRDWCSFAGLFQVKFYGLGFLVVKLVKSVFHVLQCRGIDVHVCDFSKSSSLDLGSSLFSWWKVFFTICGVDGLMFVCGNFPSQFPWTSVFHCSAVAKCSPRSAVPKDWRSIVGFFQATFCGLGFSLFSSWKVFFTICSTEGLMFVCGIFSSQVLWTWIFHYSVGEKCFSRSTAPRDWCSFVEFFQVKFYGLGSFVVQLVKMFFTIYRAE